MAAKLITWWPTLNQLVKQAIIIAVCISLNVVCFFTIYTAAEHRAEAEYLKPFQQADSLMELEIRQQYPHLSSFRTQIFQNQYFFLQNKKDFFKMRLVRFYVAYIGVVGCSLIMTLMLAGLLAFIANRGWTNTGQSTRFLFVTVALFTTLHASILAVFNLEENATNNLRLFNDHKGVQIDIYDYMTTSGRLMATDSVKVYANADSMIHNVNQQIKALNRVFYSINQSSINEISLDPYLSKAGAK
jgi:hypothetical protein